MLILGIANDAIFASLALKVPREGIHSCELLLAARASERLLVRMQFLVSLAIMLTGESLAAYFTQEGALVRVCPLMGT